MRRDMPACGVIFGDTCCDIFRAFKYSIAFLLSAAAIVGGIHARQRINAGLLVFGEEEHINAALSQTNSTDGDQNSDQEVADKIKTATLVLLIIFILIAIVNIISLLVALGTFLMECCCGVIARNIKHPCLVECFECLFGPTLVCIVQVLVFVSQVFALVLSYLFFVVMLVVVGLTIVCDLGDPAINALQDFLKQIKLAMRVAGRNPNFAYALDVNVTMYCKATRKIGEGGLILFLSCSLAVIGQTLLLAVLSEDKAHLQDEIILQQEMASEKQALLSDEEGSSASGEE